MALSYTGRRQEWQDITNASDTSTLSLGDRLMNQSEKRILASKDWPFLEKVDTTLTTVASQQAYQIPNLSGKFKSVYVTISSIRYVPREITSREDWDRLNVLTYTSDFPVWYYIFAGQLNLWPTPATSSNTIGIIYKKTAKDLSIADYTTGGVLTATNAGVTLAGTGTTWAVSMAGRFIKITESDTANKGDGYWYEIASSASTTAITLVKPYAGTAIASGNAAYAIGQMSLFPEGYTDIPVFDAARQYFATVQPDVSKFKLYDEMFKELYQQMVEEQGDKTSSPVLDYGLGQPQIINPNLYISL